MLDWMLRPYSELALFKNAVQRKKALRIAHKGVFLNPVYWVLVMVNVPLFISFKFVMIQYIPDERLHHFLLQPEAYGVPSTIPLLAVSYSRRYMAHGAWFNKRVCDRYGIAPQTAQLLAEAVQESYFPCADGSFEFSILGARQLPEP